MDSSGSGHVVVVVVSLLFVLFLRNFPEDQLVTFQNTPQLTHNNTIGGPDQMSATLQNTGHGYISGQQKEIKYGLGQLNPGQVSNQVIFTQLLRQFYSNS